MHQDTSHFPDHDEYRPERYLNAEGRLVDLVADTHQRGHLSFGSGRRYVVPSDSVERRPICSQGLSWQRPRGTYAVHSVRHDLVGVQD